MSERQVPYNLEAEEATIGALLIDPDAMDRVVATGLRANDFYIENLAVIFRAIMALHEQEMPGDYILVLSELRRTGDLQRIGGPAFLTSLISRCATSLYATHYANLIVRCAMQRHVIAAAAKVAEAAYACDGTPQEMAETMRMLLQDLEVARARARDGSPDKPTIKGVLR